MKSWQHRKVTLLWKIGVTKSLALTKIIHLLTSLQELHTAMLNELNQVFFSFIWDGMTEKIKRKTLIGSFLECSLKMVYLESFTTHLKLVWVKRLLENTSGTWQAIAELVPGKQLLNNSLGILEVFEFLGLKKCYK